MIQQKKQAKGVNGQKQASGATAPQMAPGGLDREDSLLMQEFQGNSAVAELIAKAVTSGQQDSILSFGTATSGPSTTLPYKDELQAQFGTNLGDIEAFVGTPEAILGLAAMNAEAATVGTQIAFMDQAPSKELVAHEVAHVVQGGTKGASAKGLSSPTQGTEKEAEKIAKQAAAGEKVSPEHQTGGGTIHRSLLGSIFGAVAGAIAGALAGLFMGGPLGVVLGGIAGATTGFIVGDNLTTESRELNSDEIANAKSVFGASIDCGPVTITRDSAISTGAPKTIANTVHLRSDWGHFIEEGLELTRKGQETLIHEMAHVWQYQNGGLAYIPMSLWAQAKAAFQGDGRNGAYDWSQAHNDGLDWSEWNPEQQASLVEMYNIIVKRVNYGAALQFDYNTLSIMKPYIEKVHAGVGAPELIQSDKKQPKGHDHSAHGPSV